MRSNSFKALDAVDDSASHTSAAFDGYQMQFISYNTNFSDTDAGGTVKIQTSNQDIKPTVWIDLPNSSSSITAGGNKGIGPLQICCRWYRIVWTESAAGSGTLTVDVTVQGF